MTKKILYLGLEVPKKSFDRIVVHYPIIQIVPESLDSVAIKQALKNLPDYTHIIFTSKTTVRLFREIISKLGYQHDDIKNKILISVGEATASEIELKGWKASYVAQEETSEGIVDLLKNIDLIKAFLFWPHSALSRRVIPNYLDEKHINYCECIFYDTKPCNEKTTVNLSDIDEIIFTSPSTVDAFIKICKNIPPSIKLTAIGSVTNKYLKSKI